MKVLIFGKQASGKGTQAKLIAEKYRLVHIATGDIFREIRKEDSELGKKVRALIDGGKLVPDDVTTEIVMAKLKSLGKKGFILDGYSDAEAVKRMSARRICNNSKCGEIYNTLVKKPKQEGKCDKCGSSVIQRDDDKPESIKKRLETYRRETAPIMEFYKKKGLLKEVDGTRPIESIFREIRGILDKIKH
ncbi:nucleoside monophosphate kinase [Candidatus Pacearchaeota archaeon]|nr:nucleoside monophosphate kinase [Candidatus Pacearchaeota archaeon]